MLDDNGAVVADSPAADTSTAAETTAGSQNTGSATQPTEKLTPFHQHPDWQRMVRERNDARTQSGQDRQTIQQLQQRLQALESKSQSSGLSAEQQEQRAAARKALRELIEEDPDMKHMLHSRKAVEDLARTHQSERTQERTRTALTQIESLAQKEGWKLEKGEVEDFGELVARRIARNDEWVERYRNGDASVINEAFDAIKSGFLTRFARDQANAVLQTKDKTRRLPPVSRGGAPGADAPAKLVEGKEREFRDGMHKRGADRLSELLAQQG